MSETELAELLQRVEAKIDALLREKRRKQRTLVSIAAASETLGISRSTLHEWIARKRIKAVPVGKRLRISVAELERIQRDGVPTAA